MRSLRLKRSFACLIACTLLSSPVSAVEVDTVVKPLERIPAGTRFLDQPPKDWSNVVLFVEGRIASGDVDVVSDTVAYYSKLFNLVFLANTTTDSKGSPVLDRVAVGFSMKIDGLNTVITTDTQRQLNAGLSLIGRSVLSGNEDALSDIVQVGRTPESILIDAPTVMLFQGEHRRMICRYAIWAKASGNGVGCAVWLLDIPDDKRANYRVPQETFQLLPNGMREDRVLNVKSDFFTFGIPSKEAFALVRIPQGTAIPVSDDMAKVAGARRMTAATYASIWSTMSGAIGQAKSKQEADGTAAR